MSTIINKNHIKCAVFDLDGTLLNTLDTIKYYLNSTLKSHGLKEISTEECKAFVGNGAVKLISRALNAVGADESYFDSVFREYNSAYNEDPYYLTSPYEGVREMLSELKGAGLKLGVLSNKPDIATRATIEHFFPGVFSLVLGGRDDFPLKPAPDGLLEMIEALGSDVNSTVYVGDSEPDVLTANNAHITHPIFVSYGFRTADQLTAVGAEIIFDNPQQISNYIIN